MTARFLSLLPRLAQATVFLGAAMILFYAVAVFAMPRIVPDLLTILCHQRPDRSPWLFHRQFPLCFRCSGIYLGLFAAAGASHRVRPHYRVLLLLCSSILASITISLWRLHIDLAGLLRLLSGLAIGWTSVELLCILFDKASTFLLHLTSPSRA